MSILFEAVEPVKAILEHLGRYDEDAIDRLNHKISLVIFCVLAIVVTTTQYVGETIKCWSPAQFTESWVEYADNVCWISNTYYIPMSEQDVLTAPKKEIVYYQWVPLVLFLQAFMFYLPNIFWVVLSRSIGLDINGIAKWLRSMDAFNIDQRDSSTKFIAAHVDRAFKYSRNYRKSWCPQLKEKMANAGCFFGKRYGNFLIAIYIITKLLYLGDVLLQLYLMNHFLGTDYLFYGIEVLRDLATSGVFKESRHFPRVTLCDFTVRAIGKNQPHTVQCTLPINLFNEKIFIFVWFWLALLTLLNFLSILHWLWITCTTNRRRYIKSFLKTVGKDKEYDKAKLNAFCYKYLRQDGVFLLRMISKNTNEIHATDLATLLWDNFGKRYDQERRKEQV